MKVSYSYMESIVEVLTRAQDDIGARPTTYGHVLFRSRLEAHYARHLDERGEAWAYEPRRFGSYLPDFEILGAARPTFIELKPTLDKVPAAKKKASVIWNELPNALLIIAVAEGCTYFAALRGTAWETWTERWGV